LTKKPPSSAIKAIAGKFEKDWIEQSILQRLSDLQQSEYMAGTETRELALEIETRIRQGAKIRPGALTFDRKLTMARRSEGTMAG
jgi:hypothetical protein